MIENKDPSATKRLPMRLYPLNKKKTLPQKQALSAIGQPLVMEIYSLALAKVELRGAQVLLTAGDMRDPLRRKNLQNTMRELLQWKVVPILNENDAVATEEIKFGDNDSLSAQIACMLNAQRLVILTDVEGLYDADPKKKASAQLLSHVEKVLPRHLALVDKKTTSQTGTGGMYSKILAAKKATEKGIVTHLVRGDQPRNLLRIAAGEDLGTRIGRKL